MNEDLLACLEGFRTDPALVLDLYKHLFSARLFALVEGRIYSSAAELNFLVYPARKGRELPVFTSKELAEGFAKKISAPPPGTISADVPGKMLWPSILAKIAGTDIQAAINPATPHGILFSERMIMGMIGQFGENGKTA